MMIPQAIINIGVGFSIGFAICTVINWKIITRYEKMCEDLIGQVRGALNLVEKITREIPSAEGGKVRLKSPDELKFQRHKRELERVMDDHDGVIREH